MSQLHPLFYEFGAFRLEVVERLLRRDGVVVPLKSKDFDLLLALVEHRGQVLTRDDLMKQVWPDSVVEEGNLSVHIFALRRALGETPDDHRYIVTVPGRGYSFVGNVSTSFPERSPGTDLEPVGGAVPLDSRFYIERPSDAEFQQAVSRGDSIVLVKGARQVGKTSLLARSLQRSRETGSRVVLIDFQRLNASQLESTNALFRMLAKVLAKQLGLKVEPNDVWDPDLGPSMNLTNYIESEVLGEVGAPLVWAIDEVDRLFSCSFGSEVFGLFRSWHNARSLDPHGPWRRLTLAMAYATEAHLFISDIHQSPFNVGTRLLLEDFNLAQVAELNRRYGSPLTEGQVEDLFDLVGGHPYLVRSGLFELVTKGVSFDDLRARADHDEGPFGDHLRRLLISIKESALTDAVRSVLSGHACPTADSFYRLRSAGVIVGDAADRVEPRCKLYSLYLSRHLL